MKSTFKVRDKEYEVVLEKKERGEGDKFNPYQATVSGQPEGPVQGTLQITDEALKQADDRAQKEGGVSAEQLLARAGARALASEVLIRKLRPDFSFVVDHRWL